MSDNRQIGLPQGSILGPLLLIIYMNKLLLRNSDGIVTPLADDAAIFYEGNFWKALKDKTERSVKNVKTQFYQMLLALNLANAHFITFSCE